MGTAENKHMCSTTVSDDHVRQMAVVEKVLTSPYLINLTTHQIELLQRVGQRSYTRALNVCSKLLIDELVLTKTEDEMLGEHLWQALQVRNREKPEGVQLRYLSTFTPDQGRVGGNPKVRILVNRSAQWPKHSTRAVPLSELVVRIYTVKSAAPEGIMMQEQFFEGKDITRRILVPSTGLLTSLRLGGLSTDSELCREDTPAF